MLTGAAFIIIIPEASVTLFESFSSPITRDGGRILKIIALEEYNTLTSEDMEQVALIIGASITLGFLFMLVIDKIFVSDHQHE